MIAMILFAALKPITITNHLTHYLLGYCRWVCYLVWMNSASIDSAVSSFVVGDFTRFDHALIWISIRLQTAFFGGRIFNRVNDE
jgi:hypothetical protein